MKPTRLLQTCMTCVSLRGGTKPAKQPGKKVKRRWIGTEPQPRVVIEKIKKQIEAKKSKVTEPVKQPKKKKVGSWWQRVPQVFGDDGTMDEDKFEQGCMEFEKGFKNQKTKRRKIAMKMQQEKQKREKRERQRVLREQERQMEEQREKMRQEVLSERLLQLDYKDPLLTPTNDVKDEPVHETVKFDHQGGSSTIVEVESLEIDPMAAKMAMLQNLPPLPNSRHK
ncbi:hypothetical protein GUITHDRAFT_105173 [Guillardia theta CCMP2712]|uniref:Uncharacterized protein n=1 Tax=Guillardia theta (strain CCMP2712) TaxID=905079 RepID=L1JL82_GUITC|nr:hypothetical protein GUITHDRAFT_105173 [Guillardia theta CCMP2712]EKX49092.1 hypothetical protein GUITHDRAFT_105173 [Guillardia theta CCMP2712]|eukprot:XP_005836072.1 hypothetical protein GUITHDRAFT_105173 [Guillardia theta CCMP2712]